MSTGANRIQTDDPYDAFLLGLRALPSRLDGGWDSADEADDVMEMLLLATVDMAMRYSQGDAYINKLRDALSQADANALRLLVIRAGLELGHRGFHPAWEAQQ